MTNVVPSSFTLAIHILRDKSLLSTIRHSLADAIKPGARIKFELKELEKQPLLLSMYAETLRFGVQIHVPRSSPHQNLAIGRIIVPENKLILVSTWLAHTDEEVWNTKEGNFPLHTFWPQRFLIDPKDPLSGPTKTKRGGCTTKPVENSVNEEARYSTEGLEGAWIPYGGEIFFIFIGDLINKYTSIGLTFTYLRWTSCMPWAGPCETHHANYVRVNNHHVRYRDPGRREQTRVRLATFWIWRSKTKGTSAVPHPKTDGCLITGGWACWMPNKYNAFKFGSM